nr:MAG TPA: hypothetical protein [Caudoviricetes sp.]
MRQLVGSWGNPRFVKRARQGSTGGITMLRRTQLAAHDRSRRARAGRVASCRGAR